MKGASRGVEIAEREAALLRVRSQRKLRSGFRAPPGEIRLACREPADGEAFSRESFTKSAA